MNIDTIRNVHSVRVCNGSGVIVRPLEKSYLYILTNYHVIFEADGQAKTLKFKFEKGSPLNVDNINVIGDPIYCKDNDIAIIKIDAKGFENVEFLRLNICCNDAKVHVGFSKARYEGAVSLTQVLNIQNVNGHANNLLTEYEYTKPVAENEIKGMSGGGVFDEDCCLVGIPDNSTTTTAYTVDNGSHALVTTVTDALHNVQATHTNGSGKTVKTIQKSGPDGEITTSFEYDGIQRLVRVTDTEGNVTTSTYDMGDRRTEVNHPASGITSFTYDALGNVLTKQTANLAKEGKFITYDYDYQRLTGINYPDHPENNVKYYYGGRNASQNRIGRLMLREDGTGAIEYFYGKMGEVTKTRRTMIVPNQAIATYVTQWTYDSHNRLLEMIYPDEEKITYSYNLGGQLEKVHGYKSYGYDYVSKIGYDKFEQRTYLKYCNGAETFYTYDPQRRRLQNLTVNSGGNTIMDNAYTYDAVSNVLSVVNGASVPQSGKAGGQMAHTYTYDALYRLVGATGTYTGADNKTASYTLAMGYDNMHRITSKRQILTQNNVQFNGTLNAGYDLSYTYGTETGKKFQLANVKDVNYRTEETPSESENVNNNHAYEYDANGNLVYVNTSRTKKDGIADEKAAERKLKWDEENRLLASDDNGFVTNYWYDADGERTVKTSGESDQVYVNSEFAGGRTNTAKFSLYVSPYLVANQGGRYTKHIYIGSQRVVSKIGDFDSYGSDPRRIQYAGSETDGLSVDYKGKYTGQLQAIKDNYATFAVPYNGEDLSLIHI